MYYPPFHTKFTIIIIIMFVSSSFAAVAVFSMFMPADAVVLLPYSITYTLFAFALNCLHLH
jgi:hypothetical protein